MASQIKTQLLLRKKRLQQQVAQLRKAEDELREVEVLLSTYEKSSHGQEKSGHEPGCRCHECDPSW